MWIRCGSGWISTRTDRDSQCSEKVWVQRHCEARSYLYECTYKCVVPSGLSLNPFTFFSVVAIGLTLNLPAFQKLCWAFAREETDMLRRSLNPRMLGPVHPGPPSLSRPRWRRALHTQRQTHSSLSMTFLRKKSPRRLSNMTHAQIWIYFEKRIESIEKLY